LDFVARDEMGINYAIQEQLFTRTPRKEFQRVIMRAAGDDNYPANHDAQNDGSAHHPRCVCRKSRLGCRM
jgi:hypothetical protein